MDLYLATLRVVPMMFIALFLNHRYRTRHDVRRDSATLRFFHYVVATLGLLTFSCAVFVAGAEIVPPRWTGDLITVALTCSMAALAAQAFSVLARDADPVDVSGVLLNESGRWIREPGSKSRDVISNELWAAIIPLFPEVMPDSASRRHGTGSLPTSSNMP